MPNKTDTSEEQATAGERAARVASYFAVLGVVGSLIATAAIWFGGTIESSVVPAAMTQEERVQVIRDVHQQLARIEAQQAALLKPDKLPPPLAALDARLKEVEQRQKRIDGIILDNPDKALELPLIRRDLESLDKREVASAEDLRRSLDQASTLSNGLIVSILVTLIGLTVTTIFRRKE